MADHFLETPEYESFKYAGLVYLKVIKSIKYMNLKNKFCRSIDPATFTTPLTIMSGSAPGDFRMVSFNFATSQFLIFLNRISIKRVKVKNAYQYVTRNR